MMDLNVVVIGLNHKSSPIELREIISFTEEQRTAFLKTLRAQYPLGEFVILSTCNRVEIYFFTPGGSADASKVISMLSSFHRVSREELHPFIYNYESTQAIKHLFEVAAGLDSLVIGEAQILGQVKHSYTISFDLGFTGKTLNIIFQKAFGLGKKVRTETKIGEGNVSISSIACQLVEEVWGDQQQRNVLLIGMGKIGELTLNLLQKKSASTILVSNRNHEKAVYFANKFNGKAVKLEEREKYIKEVDVVISSTSSPDYLIDLKMMDSIIRQRGEKQIFLIDLAVPRNIDPEVGKLEGVHLYNVDSLKNIANKNLIKRESEMLRCEEILDKDTKYFLSKHNRCSTDENNDILSKNIV